MLMFKRFSFRNLAFKTSKKVHSSALYWNTSLQYFITKLFLYKREEKKTHNRNAKRKTATYICEKIQLYAFQMKRHLLQEGLIRSNRFKICYSPCEKHTLHTITVPTLTLNETTWVECVNWLYDSQLCVCVQCESLLWAILFTCGNTKNIWSEMIRSIFHFSLDDIPLLNWWCSVKISLKIIGRHEDWNLYGQFLSALAFTTQIYVTSERSDKLVCSTINRMNDVLNNNRKFANRWMAKIKDFPIFKTFKSTLRLGGRSDMLWWLILFYGIDWNLHINIYIQNLRMLLFFPDITV